MGHHVTIEKVKWIQQSYLINMLGKARLYFHLCVGMSFRSLCWSKFGAVIEMISVFSKINLKADLF